MFILVFYFTEQPYSTYFVKGQKENGSKVAVWEVL